MSKTKRTEISKWFSKQGYESIEPLDFYRYMFPSGELATYSKNPSSPEANKEWKYNAILLENTHKMKKVLKKDPLRKGRMIETEDTVWKKYIVLDDLSRIKEAVNKFGKTESEFFIAPNSYLGRQRTKKNERWVYACIVEVDHPKTEIIEGHRRQVGLEQLIHDWTRSSMPYLMPSACVSSGSGLHLVYFLDRPYPIMTEYQKEQWDMFRVLFTNRIWNKLVTNASVQYENHCQVFRVVGTRTKNNHLVEAFWLSKKRYTIDELFNQVKIKERPTWETFEEMVARISEYEGLFFPDEEMKQEKKFMAKGEKLLTPKMQEYKELYPKWFEERIVQKKPKREVGQWYCHRGLYDWFLREAKENAFVGSRYNRIHALAEYAIKCAIDYDEFKEDAYELYLLFKDIDAAEPFLYDEFIKARDEFFGKIPHLSTRKWIEEKTGVPMNPPAKRNGRKRKEHLQAKVFLDKNGKPTTNVCRANRELTLEYMRDNGLIKGRPDKRRIIETWQLENPGGRKIDCERETGISRHTIIKWWND